MLDRGAGSTYPIAQFTPQSTVLFLNSYQSILNPTQPTLSLFMKSHQMARVTWSVAYIIKQFSNVERSAKIQ